MSKLLRNDKNKITWSGIFSFWRGNGAALFKVVPQKSIELTVMAPKQKKTPMMCFQKQANYKTRKKIAADEKVLERKAAKKASDRLCYLKKKELALLKKQNELTEKEKHLLRNKEAVMADLMALGKQQKQMDFKLVEVNEEVTSKECRKLAKFKI